MTTVRNGVSPSKKGQSLVIISSVHDYRMLRRGSIQSIADALARLGFDVSFISVRFSLFSLLKGDSRRFLFQRINRLEIVQGIRCYLWFTFFHPFDTKSRTLNRALHPLFALYARLGNRFFDATVRSASVIIIESGLGILLAPRIRKLNSMARLVYRASDRLETIGAPSVLQTRLEQSAELFDSFCLLASKMSSDFAWADKKVFHVPLGIQSADYEDIGPTPYGAGINAVSVGSMLFDEMFFVYAATRFPEIQFHVIGCAADFAAPENVRIYPEMKFKETLPFIKHATFGIAPYRNARNSEYLAESSLKLMQYEYLGIPAVCPHFAAGKVSSRQGYEPGNPDSIAAAVAAAMAVKTRAERGRLLSWNEVAKRLLSPSDFADCELGSRTSGQTTDTTEVAPILSLILSTLGRTTELVRLFESLKAQGDIDYEVILVDQNPVGYLDFIIESYEALLPIRHTRSPKGLSVGRNIGLQHARGRLICFPDDDCWYPPTTLKDVVTFFSRYPDIDVVLGKTVDVNGDDSLSPFRKSSGTVSKDNLWISGNSNTIFLRHTAASRIGPFDESLGVGSTTPFQSGEETDFILRALSMGMRAIFLNSLLIHHDQVDREIGDKQIRRAWNYSKGFGRVLRIHGYGRLYLVYRVLRSAGRALVSLLSLDGLQAKYKFVWAAGTLVGYSHRLEKVGADEVEGSRL